MSNCTKCEQKVSRKEYDNFRGFCRNCYDDNKENIESRVFRRVFNK
jgi:endogenous inhibitor of DNA gyrase (YacG/DUF329 family)